MGGRCVGRFIQWSRHISSGNDFSRKHRFSMRRRVQDVLRRLMIRTGRLRRTQARLVATERLEVRQVLSVTFHSFYDANIPGQYLGPGMTNRVAITSASLTEPFDGQRSMVFALTRTGQFQEAMEVTYETRDGSAVAGEDYVASGPGASVIFESGRPTATFSVPVIADGIPEFEESFDVVLTGVIVPQTAMSWDGGIYLNSHPTSVVAADINTDGKPDLIAGHSLADVISVAMNVSTPGATVPVFGESRDVAVEGRSDRVAVGDFNRDGRPDIAVLSTAGGDMKVLLNSTESGAAEASFLAPQSFPVGANPHELTVVDLNGDGKPDIVTISDPGVVQAFLNTTQTGSAIPVFEAAELLSSTTHVASVVFADFNADGKPDMAEMVHLPWASAANVRVFLNASENGSTTPVFQFDRILPTSHPLIHLTSGDVNGDSVPDLVGLSSFSSQLILFANQTERAAMTTRFADPVATELYSYPQSSLLTDLNGDGLDEVVAIGSERNHSDAVLTNTTSTRGGIPSLRTGELSRYSPLLRNVVSADFNGDLRPDVAGISRDDHLAWVLRNDPYLFSAASATGTIVPPTIDGFRGVVMYVEHSPSQILAPDVRINWPEDREFDGRVLTIAITTDAESTDRIQIRHEGIGAGQIGVSGTSVTFGGLMIGAFSGITSLEVTLNDAATPAAVQALLRNVTYLSVSDDPATHPRTISATLTESASGTVSSASVTVNVIAVSQAPQISRFNGNVTWVESPTPVRIASRATVADTDTTNFGGGVLSVAIVMNVEATDRIGIRNEGMNARQIGVNGHRVTYSGIPIGTFSGTTSLEVTFAENTTAEAIRALLRNLTFSSESDNPSEQTRTIAVSLTDGQGGTSSVSTRDVRVVAVNDGPQIGEFHGTVPYYEGDSPVLLDPDVTVADADSPDFRKGRLTVSIVSNRRSTDRIDIVHQGFANGEIGTDGSGVFFGNIRFGRFSGTDSLTVTLNEHATPAAVQALLRNITYSSVATRMSLLPKTIRVLLADGDGAASHAADKVIRLRRPSTISISDASLMKPTSDVA